jgi:hypothetical protein
VKKKEIAINLPIAQFLSQAIIPASPLKSFKAI